MFATVIVIVVIVSIIILFLSIGLYTNLSKKNKNLSVNINSPKLPSGDTFTYSLYTPPIPSQDNSRNTCKLYTYQATPSTNCINSTCQEYPPEPDISVDYLNALTPENPYSCYDTDQLELAQTEIECLSENGCKNNDGTITPLGGKVTQYSSYYYTAPDSENYITEKCGLNPCGGTLSLFALNYNPQEGVNPVQNNVKCLSVGSDMSLSIGNCTMTSPNYLFRISKTSVISNTEQQSLTISNNRSGQYCNIYYREGGKYLNVDENGNIVMGDSSSKIWYALNNLIQENVTNTTTDSEGNTTTTTTSIYSPQQLIYIEGITSSQISSIFTGTVTNIIDNINSFGLKSIQASNTSSEISLQPYYFTNDINSIPEQYALASTQFVDIQLYNQILFTDQYYPYN